MTATRDDAADTRDAVDEIISQWAQVRPELDVSAMEVFGRLHRSFLFYRLGIAEGFSEVGTNEPGFDVLATLRRSGPQQRLSAGELARRTLVTTGGLTLRVRRLEQEGYVRRERDPGDNRMVHVELTDTGRELVDRAADAHFDNMNRMLERLTSDERETLAQLLGRLYESVREAVPAASRAVDDSER
jgi:DNA-binding MarR family transcriptional regulator